MIHTNVQIPSGSDTLDRRHYALLKAEMDFWKSEAENLRAELRNIPQAIRQVGFVDIPWQDETIRLVQASDDEPTPSPDTTGAKHG